MSYGEGDDMRTLLRRGLMSLKIFAILTFLTFFFYLVIGFIASFLQTDSRYDIPHDGAVKVFQAYLPDSLLLKRLQYFYNYGE